MLVKRKKLDKLFIFDNHKNMFNFKTCKKEGCNAFATFDSDFCYRHCQNKEELYKRMYSQLKEDKLIRDITMSHGEFENISTQKREFSSSNFSFCTFRNVDFSGSKITTCFFDFCLFDDCTFEDTDIRYSVFSGSKILNCKFSDSILIHNNFSGIDAWGCDFSCSDLYFTTFCSSCLRDVSFEDCNLKKADFRETEQRRLNFKYSNYEDAAK